MTSGITLSSSPTTYSGNYAYIYGPLGSAYTVTNLGTVAATGTSFRAAVYLKNGGDLTNGGTSATTAAITGYGDHAGVGITVRPGTVTNFGIIASGTAGRAIALYAGGYVSNAASGTIISTIGSGLDVSGGAGTMVNAGSIGASGTTGSGVVLQAGGLVSNAATGTISSTSGAGVYAQGAAGTVFNAGRIESDTIGAAVALEAGGYVGNAQTGAITSTENSGVFITGAAGTVLNAGSIGVSGTTGSGILLEAGGLVSNAATGTISSTSTLGAAVYAKGAAGTVFNGGRIGSGAGGAAVAFELGGYVSNAGGGIITSTEHSGVYINGAAGTVINAGSIANTDTGGNGGVVLRAGGFVGNAATGTITSARHPGVSIAGAGTVVNAGAISAAGSAVLLAANFANRVVVDPGAVFAGAVDGGNTIGAAAVSVLELAAGSDTLAGVGSSFVNFGSIAFDPGAGWKISGSTAGLAGGEVIGGFTIGDTIDLAGVSETINSYAGGTLSLVGTAPLNLLLPGSFTTAQFSATPDGTGGTDITVACFAAGTRVLTEAGEVEVERLQPGMRVVSLLHRQLLPIVWLGHRRLRASAHPRPHEVWPVRVCAGAFAPGVPHRCLWLSPDHAVFVNNVLIPVRYLINGATIVQECCGEINYFHVELAAHGVLLAEGLPAESYLDTGNRAAFANGAAAVKMHPDFAHDVWELQACAKLLVEGPAVIAVRERLHARAQALGWTTTEAPAPLLLAGGQRIPPYASDDGVVTFHLPSDCRHAQLLSRATIDAHSNPRSTDHRRLGLAVAALALDGVDLPLNDARLGIGWHAPEPDWRWTDGAAELALAGEQTLTVRFARLSHYWIEPTTGQSRSDSISTAAHPAPSRT
jgi:hypothetical protein